MVDRCASIVFIASRTTIVPRATRVAYHYPSSSGQAATADIVMRNNWCDNTCACSAYKHHAQLLEPFGTCIAYRANISLGRVKRELTQAALRSPRKTNLESGFNVESEQVAASPAAADCTPRAIKWCARPYERYRTVERTWGGRAPTGGHP